ncbi:MAG: DUF2203 family protein [candidate division Zixibacteria bacterium]|nr:DUF2203 family protein [candidate division Zixibacteria bacterium]
MPMFEKHFTVEEANELLPHVASVFERVHSIREELGQVKEHLGELHQAVPGNGGSEKGAELVTKSEIIAQLIAGLQEKGIQVKDIDIGLVDFPHMRDAKEVFLCWKLGEKSIGFWHDIETGYRGRQPL